MVHNVHVKYATLAEWKILDAMCSKIINKSPMSYIFFIFLNVFI